MDIWVISLCVDDGWKVMVAHTDEAIAQAAVTTIQKAIYTRCFTMYLDAGVDLATAEDIALTESTATIKLEKVKLLGDVVLD